MATTSSAILFSFAHPDDESFSGAGTAMKYAAAGVRVVLSTATLGERGKVGDPPVCAPGELGACRERELRDAAAIIGFDQLHLLGYRDRELADAPPDEIRRKLVSIIRRLRPSVVLTFDANGFNLHPDHVAISRFTSDAIAAAADPRWFPDAGPAHVVQRLLWTAPIPPWEAGAMNGFAALKGCATTDGATIEGATTEVAGVDFVLDVSQWRERKLAALKAHRTQHLSINRYFLHQPDLDRILSTEIWRHAWGPRLNTRPAADILVDI